MQELSRGRLFWPLGYRLLTLTFLIKFPEFTDRFLSVSLTSFPYSFRVCKFRTCATWHQLCGIDSLENEQLRWDKSPLKKKTKNICMDCELTDRTSNTQVIHLLTWKFIDERVSVLVFFCSLRSLLHCTLWGNLLHRTVCGWFYRNSMHFTFDIRLKSSRRYDISNCTLIL